MKIINTLLVLTALAGVATAATLVQTKDYSFVPDGTPVLTFNKFNTALGTLTSITITTNVTKSEGSLFVDNESATAASGDISQSVTITLSSTDVLLLAATGGMIGANIEAKSIYAAVCGADDNDGFGVQTTGLDYSGTVFGPTPPTSETKTVHDFAMPGYQGTGTYNISADGHQGFNTTAIGGAAVEITPARASGDVTVTYFYDAIPETSTALLGGLGLLAMMRRRRQ